MPRENRFLSHFRPQGREFWIVKREKGNGKRKTALERMSGEWFIHPLRRFALYPASQWELRPSEGTE